MSSRFEKFNRFLCNYIECNDKKLISDFLVYLKKTNVTFPLNDYFRNSLFATFLQVNRQSSLVELNINARGILRAIDCLESNPDKLFVDFWILSFFLEESGLNSKECTSILFSIMEKNWQVKMKDSDTSLLSGIELQEVDIKSIKADMIHNFFLYGLEDFWKEKVTDDMSNIEEVKRERPALEDLTLRANFDCSIEKFCSCCIAIKKHYFEKKDSFDLDDIKKIVDIFEVILPSPRILAGVENTLKKELSKRKEKVKSMNISWTSEQKKSRLLSDKEYKKLRKELESYYRIYQNEFVRDIDYSEMIYCLSLMYELGIDESNIDQFLLKYRLTSTLIKDPIQWFVFSYEKLFYHQKDVRVMTSFQQLLEYMSDIFVVGDEEYSYVKEEMQKEQNKIEHLLIDNFEYEKILAKKALKKRLNL